MTREDGGGVLELLERIGSVVVPIAVALYAVLYIGIEQMYAVFGVNPQQVGVDQAVLLGRMTSTLVLLLLVAVPLLGVFVGLGWLADRMTRGAAGRLVRRIREQPWIAAALAALWCGATYWGLFNLFGDLDLFIMVVIAVGLGVLAFLIPFRLLRHKPVGRAGTKVLVGGLTGVGLGFLLILGLVEGAIDVQNSGQSNELLNAVGFQDQWAVVKSAEDDKPLYDGRWMMLLGESDGTYVLYDCDKLETLRRPMETTNLGQIELDPAREAGFACGGLAQQHTP
ncbi:hypothetical protein [Nonomuraea africana]|uniref:ABC-type antimicrobial peptide transport system permease subunit n=1 Tax=Nonomuraea africana TaxID=46171 RepID=A0ABR9KSB5_9ACTN|nr:hypothetical protein [Nonomuraea africana]MBE1564630.1 ABC-type antimicrobial peptide transport system permease subunit [Nonomuraea africana]